MRFQPGVSYPYPEHRRRRGRGRGDYRMSRKAGEARQRNLACVKRPRTPEQTERIQLEIALWKHRPAGESLRALAARLGLKSHAHCWRVARNYRAGLIEWLSPAESGLLAMRDSLDAPLPSARPCVKPPEPPRIETTAPGTVASEVPPHIPAPAFDKAKALREAEEHALREELVAREERSAGWR